MNIRPEEIIEKALSEQRSSLDTLESLRLLESYDLPVVPYLPVNSLAEVETAAQRIEYPLVVKPISPSQIHKSDLGLVKLNVRTIEELTAAYNEIYEKIRTLSIPSKGLIVQKMAPPGLEIVIGGINDDQFGPALMLGLGGIMIEIFKDVVFRIAPISEEECHSMIKQLKAYPLIEGYRGRGPYDEKILAQTLEKTSYLLMENPQIKELDLNPIILYQKDCLITDARIILENKS